MPNQLLWTLTMHLIVYVSHITNTCGETQEVKIGLLLSKFCCNYKSLSNQASAISIAFEKLRADGVLPKNTTLKPIWRDTLTESEGVGNVVKFVQNDGVDIIFGSPSSMITVPVAFLTSYWNFPHITWSANSYDLTDKTKFTTLVRTVGPLSESGRLLVTLFKKFGWKQIALLYIDSGMCEYSANGLKKEFGVNNLVIMQSVVYPRNAELTDAIIDEYLSLVKQTSRIIFLCTEDHTRRFVVRACELGMCNGDFVFIYTMIYVTAQFPWKLGLPDDAIAKAGYKNMVYISRGQWVDNEAKRRMDEFLIDVVDRMAEPPWNDSYAKNNNFSADIGVSDLHDAMYLYGLWLNHTTDNELDHKDGAAFLNFSRGMHFEGISGPCDIGINGDRVPYFWVHQYVGSKVEARMVAISENMNTVINDIDGGFIWDTADGMAPRDVPKCGFYNELCLVYQATSSTTLEAEIGKEYDTTCVARTDRGNRDAKVQGRHWVKVKPVEGDGVK
ncbi:receptor-type guanylate cyclase gcy-6-like [Mya arenaria]|uniref:receptor-type guanylate cyclase gcy-6-like n=1 Tax=Mya arenaria TaxID=6604 RepID=UPI0022DFD32A|nr:receptor-type guanylate cyclase gcy-6-like [Mya arenaria]